jgi:succinate-acetate transporter protein
MAINVTDLNNRCVTTSTVGYMALALTGWMLSMTAAGWYDRFYLSGTSLMLPFATLLAIIGILAYLHGRSLDSIAFFAFAVLYTAGHAGLVARAGSMVPTAPMSYIGWFWIVWTVFFGYTWLGSFRAGLPRQLFLLGITLTFLAKALYGWSDARVLELISGYLGLISSIIAAFISASEVIVFGREAHSPNDDHVDHAAHPHAV